MRNKRRAQAEFLANLIQSRQTGDPTENIISVGDYNAFQFNDGYVDVIGTVKGQPAPPDQVVLASSDLVNPDLTDLIDSLPSDQRYSFTFDGSAQSLDHELVNTNMLAILNRFAYARTNADFPQKYYEDPMRPERLSDHDIPVAYFEIPAGPTPTPTPTPTPQVCTTTVTDDPDLPPSGLTSFTVTSGPNSVTVDHANAGTGLQTLEVLSATNVTVNIPP
ncbi:MAG: hypothetical protein LC776_06495, partial [Acidobacteria bacterium]|nr:hypothetical protein [Acidobacteriota bacterium]